MKDFAAIDFETANEQRTSVCSVGVVIVRDGEIVDHYYSLIRPSRSIILIGNFWRAWLDVGRYPGCSYLSRCVAGNSSTH